MIQKFLSSLSDKEKRYLYIASFIVLIALVDRFFLAPVLNRIELIEDEIKQEKVSILRDTKFLLYKDKILKESKIFDKYFSKEAKDPDVINAEFLSTLEKLATESKVNLVKSSPLSPKQYDGYAQYYASLDCIGNLKDIMQFMYSIDTSKELLKVISFNLSPKRGGNGKINASMTISKLLVEPVPSDE